MAERGSVLPLSQPPSGLSRVESAAYVGGAVAGKAGDWSDCKRRAHSGATLTYHKHSKPALGPLGNSLDDMGVNS
jgi:hypothetical protein